MRASDEIPGPPPANSIFAAYRLMQAVRSDLLGVLVGAFREHGDLVKLEVLGRKQILCIAPADVRKVLLDEAHAYEKGRDYTDPRKGLAKFAGAIYISMFAGPQMYARLQSFGAANLGGMGMLGSPML